MPIEDTALLAAVNAGIAEAAPAPAPAPIPTSEGDDDEPAATTSVADPAPGADGSGDGGGKTGHEADDVGGAPADGVVEGGDGVSVPGDKPAVDKTPEALAAEAAAAEAARPKDHLNDPLPNALKKETKERIQSLVGMVKENTTKLDAVTRDRDEIFNAITETRATPEQYGQALTYLRMVNSPQRGDREQALQFMQGEVAALARMLGKPVPGVNMLEGHQDLIDEVSTGRLSPERAQEIAASRHAASFERESGALHNQQQRDADRQQQTRAQGVRELNALEGALKAENPTAYAAKRKFLIESLKPVFAQIPPSQWAATFKRAYDALPTPARPTPPPPIPAKMGEGNTPLRASNPAGAARPAPTSLLEAINQGIAEAR